MRVANPLLQQNWITPHDVRNLLYQTGFEVTRLWQEILWPIRTPGVNALFNKFLVKLWPFNHAAFTNFVLARPAPAPSQMKGNPTVSVVVAARNEEGNIDHS